jgi:poly(3-hydroxybutyrate) depolymerase
MPVRLICLASVLLLSALSVASHAQQIEMANEIIDGEPIPFSISEVPAATDVIVDAQRVDAAGTTFTSSATYRSSASGRIDPATIAATGGSYTGVDAAGLFWSMLRTDGISQAPGTITLTVRISDRILTSRSARLIDPASTVEVEEIADFAGARLYRRRGDDRVPVVILLGGSEGGSSYGRELGPQMALRGYAAIALPYYNPDWTNEGLPGLPTAFVDIPVDRLGAVHRWIQSRDDLDASRIGISGVSKGGEFAMIAATRFSWLRAVIGIVPSDVVWEGWGTRAADGTSSSFAWNGRALPFTPYSGMSETIAALSRGERRSLIIPHLDGRTKSPERAVAARIPVERFRGAMFIAGGDKDRTWPSGEMVRAIAERRAARGRQTVALSFRGAGHGLSGSGWEPMNLPGNDTLVADAAARRIIWAGMWDFLDATLRRGP